MNKQGRRRKVEGGFFSRPSRCAHLSFPLPPSSFRLGTTLIELLITITIIAILSATFLGVSNVAMESAREARTKTTIGKIDGLLMEKWNSYATRRVDIDTSILSDDGSGIESSNRRNRGILMAFARLDAIRILMKQEIPDRWSDIIHQKVADRLPSPSNTFPAPIRIAKNLSASLGPGNSYDMWLTYPAVANSYLRRYNALVSDVQSIEENQGAECLYMIIMLTTGDGEARTLFSPQDIGDTDADGAPEFLDGWGRPIQFSRWPAGFAEAGLSSLMTADADSDHDPLDFFRVHNPPNPITSGSNQGYRLVPLIYSSGADGISDLHTAKDDLVLNPYSVYTDTDTGITTKLGALSDTNNDGDDNSLDNIHNHLQDNK